MQITSEISYKFKYVKNGQAQGFRSKKAQATSGNLTLDGCPLQYEDIIDTTSRDNRIILQLVPNAQIDKAVRQEFSQRNILILEVQKTKAIELEKFIDRNASLKLANKRKNALVAAGQGDKFRAITCPHCAATIDLTDYKKSTYAYCRYCESILNKNLEIVANGDQYRHCDECNLFDRVQGHTEFYFYFLLIVYGFRSKRRHLCDACALKISNRALLMNLPFILGIFPALNMRIKASRGKAAAYKNMTQANRLAKDGKYDEADQLYTNMLMEHPSHPGILFNQSLSHFNGDDSQKGINYISQSIRGGSNYLPSLRFLNRIQKSVQTKQAAH